jgi:UDP-N-acetylglucosamine 2-epimerase (non-hydrolysing)
VLRDVTERPEAVAAGTLKVIGTNRDRLVKEASLLLDDNGEYDSMANAVNPFGDGRASERIVNGLLYYFNKLDKKPEEFTNFNPKK